MRARPDWISSAMSSTSFSVQASRTSAQNPAGGTTTPASPWIGSMRTAAVFGPMASRTACASP